MLEIIYHLTFMYAIFSKVGRRKNMKQVDSAKLPTRTSAENSDQDYPSWCEDMLGEPIVKLRSGAQTESCDGYIKKTLE